MADNIKWASPPYDTVSAGFTCGPLSAMKGRSFYLPSSSWGSMDAYCVIVNTASTMANITYKVYDAIGVLKKTTVFSIPAKGTARSWNYVGDIQTIADPALQKITSDQDVVVEGIRWEESRRGWGFSVFPSTTGTGTRFLIPFGALDNGNINLGNAGTVAAGVTLKVFSAAGINITEEDFAIPAHGVVRSHDILGNVYSYGKPVSVFVISDQPLAVDNIKWASPPYDTVSAGFTCGPLPLMRGRLFYYPRSSFGQAEAYTVMANATASAAAITMSVYDSNGTLMTTVSFNIAAKGTARSWDHLGSIQAIADPALIKIVSTQDIVVEAVRWEQRRRGWGFALLPVH